MTIENPNETRHADLHGFVHYLFQHQIPKLAFDPLRVTSREALDRWQTSVRTRFRRRCRFPEPSPQPPPRMIWTRPREGYSIQKWELCPESGRRVPFLVLVPDGTGAETPAAAVMCFPGTADNKETIRAAGGGVPARGRRALFQT